MGQKVNPIGLRLGINRNWESRWFPSKDRAPSFIAEDYKIRKLLKKELYFAGVSNIIIERTAKRIRITIVTARPGIVIGKKGADIEKLKAKLHLRAKIDYGYTESLTTYGNIGVKVWIFKGEVLQKGIQPEKKETRPNRRKRRGE